MDLLRLPAAVRTAAVLQRTICITQCRSIATENYRPSHTELPPQTSLPTDLSSPALLTLQSETLNSYSVSNAPSPAQLKYSNHFFASSPPHYLWSAAYFRQAPQSNHPEVAFLGRSNVGKSSLLNALLNRTNEKVAHVSKRPGRTKTMNAFGVGGEKWGKEGADGSDAWKRMGRGGVVIVDMPGYGGGSREEWGAEITKYLENRKQLRRTFMLIDAEHGLKSSDMSLLQHFRQKGISHQVILSKVDKLLYPGPKPPGPQRLSNSLLRLRQLSSSIREEATDGDSRGAMAMGDILCCSAEKALEQERGRRSKLGIDEVRWAVLQAAGLESDETGQRKRYSANDYRILMEDDGGQP